MRFLGLKIKMAVVCFFRRLEGTLTGLFCYAGYHMHRFQELWPEHLWGTIILFTTVFIR